MVTGCGQGLASVTILHVDLHEKYDYSTYMAQPS